MDANWKPITEDKAWKLCDKSGITPPYAGYMRQLSNGAIVRCVREKGETKFELNTEGVIVKPFKFDC